MRRSVRFKITLIVMYIAFVAVFIGGCKSKNEKEAVGRATSQSSSSSTPINTVNYVSREALANRLEQQEKELKESPDNNQNRIAYAQTLYALGNFDYVETVIEPLLAVKKPMPAALELSAKLHYLYGRYEKSEALYQKLLEQKNEELTARAKEGLLNVYYQTNQFQKAQQLKNKKDEKSALQKLMETFGEEQPYQVNWNSFDKVTIPLTTADPAPVIPIEVNGVKMNAVIDTGADGLLLDKEKAAELEVNPVVNFRGKYEGGGSSSISYGRADSLKLGELEVRNIPTTISSLANLREVCTDVPDVHAVIGTGVLKQFIPTINYKTGEITLLPRGEAGRKSLKEMLPHDKLLDQVPFTLSGTHYLHTKGSVNRNNYLNMFIHSGLVTKGGNGPILSGTLMKLLKMPVPQLRTSQLTGIDGEPFQVGSVNVSSYGLGRLVSEASIGQYYSGEVLESLSQANGFVSDAMVGHNFLKNQTWTIDFDERKIFFSKPDE